MRYGIFADVHSNREALEAVMTALEADRVERLLCVGDLVGYGPDPVPCLERIRQAGALAVGGNHDWATVGKMPLDWFDAQAREAIEWTSRRLPEDEKTYLERLPLTWRDPEVTLAHGSLHEPGKFHYVQDLTSAAASLNGQETAVAFIGHTHRPGIFCSREGTVRFLRAERFRAEPGEKALVNVGSVGQPRDGDPRAAYALYDSQTRVVEIRRVRYPLEQTQAKIRSAGLPDFLAERLALGY